MKKIKDNIISEWRPSFKMPKETWIRMKTKDDFEEKQKNNKNNE